MTVQENLKRYMKMQMQNYKNSKLKLHKILYNKIFFYHQVKKVILKVKFLSKPKTAQIIKK